MSRTLRYDLLLKINVSTIETERCAKEKIQSELTLTLSFIYRESVGIRSFLVPKKISLSKIENNTLSCNMKL